MRTWPEKCADCGRFMSRDDIKDAIQGFTQRGRMDEAGYLDPPEETYTHRSCFERKRKDVLRRGEA